MVEESDSSTNNDEIALEREDVFTLLDNEQTFIERIGLHYDNTYIRHGLGVEYLDGRLAAAFDHYQRDLRRVSALDEDNRPLDHLKRAGHLAYWLRRTSPIMGAHERESGNARLLSKDRATLLFGFANEFAAFDAGFRICRFFEALKKRKRDELMIMVALMGGNQSPSMTKYRLSMDYYLTVSHFLREKNVSPHALFLIYKALFEQIIRKD